MDALLLSLTLASPPQAPLPPQAPPVREGVYDPYNLFTYDRLIRHVEAGMHATLFVGVKDTAVGTYQTHLWVPAGFKGIADGVYDCYLENGKLLMKVRVPLPPPPTPARAVPAVPFSPTPTTPATTVPHAAGASFWSPGSTPTAATTTGAPRVGRFGTTNTVNCST